MCVPQWRGERYDGTSTRTGPLESEKKLQTELKDSAKKLIKIFHIIRLGPPMSVHGLHWQLWTVYFFQFHLSGIRIIR